MSEEKPEIVFVTVKMPDGKEYEMPLPAKTFSSGRSGFYAQISSIVYKDEVYGGQIQIWNKSQNPEKQWVSSNRLDFRKESAKETD